MSKPTFSGVTNLCSDKPPKPQLYFVVYCILSLRFNVRLVRLVLNTSFSLKYCRGLCLETSGRGTSKFLFAVEGVGAVFVGIFLAAYLGGLFVVPQTTVFHSDPAVKLALTVLGAALLVLILVSVVLAIAKRR